MAGKVIIERLQQSGDVEGLMEMLHYPQDAELREDAAQALGELVAFDAVEYLIRSTLLDPDPAVKKASRQALDQILGNRAQNTIDLYPVDPAEKEGWLTPVRESLLVESENDNDADDEEYDDEDEGDEDLEYEETGEEDKDTYQQEEIVKTAETGGWMGSDLSPLITILRTEGNVRMRVRAARALGQMSEVDTKAVDALAETALWSDSPSVRAAATKSLVKLFGDKEADELLHTYREAKGITGWNDDFYKDEVREDLDEVESWDEEVNEDQEETVSDSTPLPAELEPRRDQTVSPGPLPYTDHPPVVQNESDGKGVLAVLVVIIILVLVGLAFYLGLFN
jgi:hypothetical protein